MNREFSAGVVVFYEQAKKREFLLLLYPSGHWDLPKGHIEKNESKHEAALRELHEETGLSAKLYDGFEATITYFRRVPETKELMFKTVYFFLGKGTTKEVTLSFEHEGFQWLPEEEALEKLTYDNAKEVMRQAAAFLKNQDEIR